MTLGGRPSVLGLHSWRSSGVVCVCVSAIHKSAPPQHGDRRGRLVADVATVRRPSVGTRLKIDTSVGRWSGGAWRHVRSATRSLGLMTEHVCVGARLRLGASIDLSCGARPRSVGRLGACYQSWVFFHWIWFFGHHLGFWLFYGYISVFLWSCTFLSAGLSTM